MRKQILIPKGNDKDLLIRVKKGDMPVDLTTIDVYCEVKDKPGGNLLFVAQVVKKDAVNGLISVRFSKENTATLKAGTKVYFDLRLVWADGTEKNYPVPPFEALVVERVTD